MFSTHFISHVLEETPYGNTNHTIDKFIVNSKMIIEGNCFIGLPGEKCHGSSFFEEALKLGASGLILDKSYKEKAISILSNFSCWIYFVEDTKKALLSLAKAWRMQLLHIPIIAITGSVGKTTTKEMIKKICIDAGLQTLATENSENGSIGLPLTLLNLRSFHDIAIIEVGIQKPGEMDLLIPILQKIHTLVITTIMLAHAVYFKTIETVMQEKMKLQHITYFLIIAPDSLKEHFNTQVKILSVGTQDTADYTYTTFSSGITIYDKKNNKKYNIEVINHQGLHHCTANAFAFSLNYHIAPQKIITSLENYKNIPGRFSTHQLRSGSIIINDAYNAAHITIMQKAIDAFILLTTDKKKIIILGDMLEQGDNSLENHKNIYEKINALETYYEKAYLIGKEFASCYSNNKNAKINFFPSINDCKEKIDALMENQHYLFFKSSRSMALYNYVTEYLKNNENK